MWNAMRGLPLPMLLLLLAAAAVHDVRRRLEGKPK